MLAEISPPQEATGQLPPPSKGRVGLTAHILVFIFALTGVMIQLFVPWFVEVLNKVGEQPLPALTVTVLHHQYLCLGMAALMPPATFYFAWRNRFRVPFSAATIVLIVFAAVLELGTAYALLSPMRAVLVAAESITPQASSP